MSLQPLTKDFLEKAYCEEGLSTWAIETKYGFTRSRVYSALKRYGLPTRNVAQSHVRYPRKNFSGDRLEAAYLIGFSLGDLRVRNHGGEQSETISIACGSTKRAQIRLVRELFSKYGRVWVGKPNDRGVVNVEAFVDKSFSFLLKTGCNYDWCADAEGTFFAFLAGFTDAEGSFYITRGMARIAWGNYDTRALGFIRDGLQKFGIQSPNIHSDALKGYIGVHGYARNDNYAHISCARKEVIRDVIRKVGPHIRHTDKKVALMEICDNLISRGVTV